MLESPKTSKITGTVTCRKGENLAYQHLSATSALLIGCFGAQAVLGGLFIWFSRWERVTFLVYAIALLPFFAFNYWFVYEAPNFNRP